MFVEVSNIRFLPQIPMNLINTNVKIHRKEQYHKPKMMVMSIIQTSCSSALDQANVVDF